MGAIEPWVTLGMALAFCAVHVFVGRLSFLHIRPRSASLSFAGGVAVGYIFMHIMPELGAHGGVFAAETDLAEPLARGWVYAIALAGLVLFYGIERSLVISSAASSRSGGSARPGASVFWLHIAASAIVAAIIAYLLNHREDATPAGLGLFFIALLLHFVSADFGTRTDHPELYDRQGRWVLAAATLAGWAAGIALNVSELVIGCLFAFVAGAVVMLALKEELPEESESRFGPFLAGAVSYSALVLGELWLAGH